MPGAIEALTTWLRNYKDPLVNEFSHGGKAQNAAFAKRLIAETHEEWEKLIHERGARAVVSRGDP